ncbi:MAG: EAL domain-containing protein [Campylobacterota bacterium]|nr:EAL domain-containing protein [Campylobacterota bacterium]
MKEIKYSKDIRVLYVEDDLVIQKSMFKTLNRMFKHIEISSDGLEGLNKFKELYKTKKSIHIIIADINMPKMDGLDMIKEIKKIENDIYTIILSANSDSNSLMKSINLGVKGYVNKPINILDFVDKVEIAIDFINLKQERDILIQYKDIVDRSSIVSKTDKSGNITFVNDKFCKISKYSKDELIGKNHRILKDLDSNPDIFIDLWKTISSKKEWKGQIKNRAKDGSIYYVDAVISPILNENGDIYEYIALRNDITDIINAKRQLLDRIQNLNNLILVIIKIDKYSNYEHLYDENIMEKLDMLFKNISMDYTPEGCSFDEVYSLGYGEYAYVKEVPENISFNATEKELQLKQFQQNISKQVFIVDEYEFNLNVYISFSTQKDKIFENTKYGIELALEKNIDIVFANNLTQNIEDKIIKNENTIKMIKKAISDNRIVSYFQPITNNDTMEVEKYESLVRLIDENGKVLSPYFFLDVAKKSGYYNKITQIVIENYFKALDKTDKEISLNLSAIDIENLEIRNKLINLVTSNFHNANRMVFELLEDEEVKDFSIVKDFISLVKTFGVKIAIDDFGAGVSNYERLLDYQPDILKIDACLIKNIDKDKYSRDVVETLQLFAWKQKIKTVGEFVETKEILQTIKDIGINYTQGYLLGKPELLEFYEK